MSAKLTKTGPTTGGVAYLFYCPGCQVSHAFYVDVPGYPSWTFDGDMDKPTFAHSLINRWPSQDGRPTRVCHLYLRAGVIEFLGDCTHDLAGQKVPLEDSEP